MFTKQHYEAIAILFKSTPATNKWLFVSRFSKMFAEDSPSFDEDKFILACGYRLKPADQRYYQ